MQTLAQVLKRLNIGESSRSLVEGCLARIADPAGEGSRAFINVSAEAALAASDQHDDQRRARAPSGPFAGIPLSVKDLFDVAGEVTTAGSVVLRDAPPATVDAPSVARLRAAGFIPVGRTNMTEFAYSGLGVNPHYGTPRNIYDRKSGRIPGGSSSGAAVSITDEMAYAALGTDTGGSCRIPAALCGTVGFKPTAGRVPLEGAFPLSHSLDSIGSLAASVSCVAAIDAILAGEAVTPLPCLDVKSLKFAVPQTFVLDGMDDTVARTFEAALAKLRAAGATIVDIPLRELGELPGINSKGGFPAAEAYALHKDMMAQKGGQYDPRVLVRIMRGTEQNEADYRALRDARADLIERTRKLTSEYDAILMPTVPVVAPLISEMESDEAYGRLNLMMLRNPTVANFLDRCAVSVPCHRAGDAPVGLGLMGEHGTDRWLLAIAGAVESIVAPTSS
jgi:aspartyl-tRNA(Asn)/glutamyl-tRNA(Gln) amidotransferase subunit A